MMEHVYKYKYLNRILVLFLRQNYPEWDYVFLQYKASVSLRKPSQAISPGRKREFRRDGEEPHKSTTIATN